MDCVDLCVVYNERKDGAKLSIRSCSRDIMASEFVKFLTDGVGSGGGHRDKAGGYIQISAIDETGLSLNEYIRVKTEEYFSSYDVFDAANHNINTGSMKRYVKKLLPTGFVVSVDVFPENTPLLIRTLEGDSNVKASPGTFLMIGIQGEVYPINAETFDKRYKLCDQSVRLDEVIYTPTVKNELTGEVAQLFPHMKSCVPINAAAIFAAPLERAAKVFTNWNPNGYMYGKPGDFLAVLCDNINDVYIIGREIFGHTYEECGIRN